MRRAFASGNRGATITPPVSMRAVTSLFAVILAARGSVAQTSAESPPLNPSSPSEVTSFLFGGPLVQAPSVAEKANAAQAIELPPPPPANPRYRLEASWDSGLRLESDDEQFHVHIGGNAQVDSTWLIGPDSVFAVAGGGENGVENASATFLRRVRLRFEGDIYDQFDYIVEYDLAHAENENSGLQPNSFGNIAGAPTPCNIWMQIREVPFAGNVRFGLQVKPLGMTNNTYQGFLPFLERADNMDAFYGPFDSGFVLGLSARNWSE